MILRRLSLALWLMLLASFVSAQDSARIEGTVTDASGAIYPGAVVHLIEWRGNARGLANIARDESLACDSNGQYSFSVAPGIYDVSIGAITQSPVVKRFHVVAGKTYKFSPSLKMDPAMGIIY